MSNPERLNTYKRWYSHTYILLFTHTCSYYELPSPPYSLSLSSWAKVKEGLSHGWHDHRLDIPWWSRQGNLFLTSFLLKFSLLLLSRFSISIAFPINRLGLQIYPRREHDSDDPPSTELSGCGLHAGLRLPLLTKASSSIHSSPSAMR